MLIKPFRLILPLILAFAAQLATAAPFALVTILQGDATLLRDTGKFQIAEGVALKPEDIVELSTKALLLRIEYADGTSLTLGTGSRVLIAPRLGGDRAKTRAYVMAGWAKFSLAPGAEGTLASSLADLSGKGSRGVLGLSPGRAQVFAEAGEWQVRHGGGGAIEMKGGDFVTVPATGKPETASRPSAEFIQALPRPFMDTLPARAKLFAGKEVQPKSVGMIRYADAQDWLTVPEVSLRRAELSRWRSLARGAEFRKDLIDKLSSHPEWGPILFPPLPASAARAAN